MRQMLYNWGPALLGLALVIVSQGACGTLPCNEACTPEQRAAQDTLTVETDYNGIFGKEWVAGVSVDGKTATEHFPKKDQ